MLFRNASLSLSHPEAGLREVDTAGQYTHLIIATLLRISIYPLVKSQLFLKENMVFFKYSFFVSFFFLPLIYHKTASIFSTL